MQPVRAVVFDLGHTLWDYAPTEQARRLSTLQLHARLVDDLGDATPHPRELDRALLRQLEKAIGDWYADGSSLEQPSSDVFIRRALSALEGPVSEQLVDDVTQIFFGSDFDVPVVLPDTLAAIATMHAQGIAMGCITNTIALPCTIEELLRRLGLVRYLDSIITSSGAGYRKPHASLFQRALDGLAVAAQETVFVGDRLLDDVSGAKAIGMRAVLTHQYRQEPLEGAVVAPDAVIKRLAELPDVIERLRA
jgi:HAD superfamily hydrolase (TIGR01662 family)